MKTRRLLLALLAGTPFSFGARAQSYPSRPVTFVVPFGAAAPADILARALAQGVAEESGQAVVVDNKAGANGFIGAQFVANAPPDGYTVLISANSTQILNNLLFKKVPYDGIKDFVPLAPVCGGALVLTVSAKSQFRTMAELIDFARKNPGKLTVGSHSPATRLAGELFQQLAGIKMLHVPYKALGPGVTDQMGGQIDVLFPPPDFIAPHLKAGNLRALGVTGKQRMVSLMPEVPTIEEAGLANYELTYWYGAWMPKGTPPAVAQRMRELITRAVAKPQVLKFFAANAFEPMQMNREEFARFQESEVDKWGTVMKKAGIVAE